MARRADEGRFEQMDGPSGMVVRPIGREDSPWDSNNEDEHRWWPRAFWIDPGKVSGIAAVWLDPLGLLEGWPLPRCLLARMTGFLYGPEVSQAKAFVNLASWLDGTPGLVVGCESFTIRQFNQSEDFLSPVRIKSMLDFHFSAVVGKELWSQSPSDAKTSITDPRLRLWGLYDRGPDHQRDALRHGLLWAKKVRGRSKAEISRLHGEEEGWWESR